MEIGPKVKKNFLAFFCTYVCMSRPKSLNISRSPNARALILVSKHFYIWGIDAFKIVSELVGGFAKKIYTVFLYLRSSTTG